MTKQKMKLALVTLMLMSATVVVQAQGPGDPDGDPDPTEIPFDGGLSLVVAAGVAYAAKKGIDKRKKAKSE
ncbi:MAG TPA: hypothetical protein VMR70_17670 [Flavisolibacter sp.]|nr:hypothetical protein [Flavisolibacter sp.]